MRRFCIALIALIALAAAIFSVAAHAQEPARFALLIGNKSYTDKVGPLKNPHNDITLLKAALEKLRFKVTVVPDATYVDMDSAFKRHLADVRRAGANAISFFYYSGHGVANPDTQINYLIPVDVADANDPNLWYRSFEVNDIIEKLSRQAPRATHYVVFDACRNELNLSSDGQKALGAEKGFVAVSQAARVLIAYATAPGRTASDLGEGGGPYARALAEEIVKPGLEAVTVFRNVQIKVHQSINQDPWLSNSSLPEVYFAGKSAVGAQAPLAATAPPSPAIAFDPAERAWNAIRDTTSVAIIEAFMKEFGDSFYARFARARLEELKKGQTAAVAPPVAPPAPPTLVQPAVGVFDQSRKASPLAVAEERALKPKHSFKECDACPQMIVVPAGSFTMGSPANEPMRESNEGPQHQVTFERQFAVGRFSVTFAEWDSCVVDGGCNGYKPSDQGWGRGNRPVINVSWDDAKTYLAWLSRKTGKTYRLLSESEREYVTRAGTATPFWWGSSISTDQANYNGDYDYGGGSKGQHRERTLPVNSFEPNPWGLYQVHGNISEWAEDCWNNNYNGAPTNGSAWTSGSCTSRVLRGGSWGSLPWGLRSAYRYGGAPSTTYRFYVIGFRVARTLSIAP